MILLIFFPLPLEKVSGNRENHPTDRPSFAGAIGGHWALRRSSAEPHCHGGTQVKQQWENSRLGPSTLLKAPPPRDESTDSSQQAPICHQPLSPIQTEDLFVSTFLFANRKGRNKQNSAKCKYSQKSLYKPWKAHGLKKHCDTPQH